MSKTFHRDNLPESINYNKKVFKLDIVKTSELRESKAVLTEKNIVVVNVLKRSLKGKSDLHGKPYKPTVWIFTPQI